MLKITEISCISSYSSGVNSSSIEFDTTFNFTVKLDCNQPSKESVPLVRGSVSSLSWDSTSAGAGLFAWCGRVVSSGRLMKASLRRPVVGRNWTVRGKHASSTSRASTRTIPTTGSLVRLSISDAQVGLESSKASEEILPSAEREVAGEGVTPDILGQIRDDDAYTTESGAALKDCISRSRLGGLDNCSDALIDTTTVLVVSEYKTRKQGRLLTALAGQIGRVQAISPYSGANITETLPPSCAVKHRLSVAMQKPSSIGRKISSFHEWANFSVLLRPTALRGVKDMSCFHILGMPYGR